MSLHHADSRHNTRPVSTNRLQKWDVNAYFYGTPGKRTRTYYMPGFFQRAGLYLDRWLLHRDARHARR